MENKQGLPYPPPAALTPPSPQQAANFVKGELQVAAKEQQNVRSPPRPRTQALQPSPSYK